MSGKGFVDRFGAVSGGYAAFRPTYPPPLFEWLASAAPARRLAWDCATGSGQAAHGLARHYARVVGSDASAAQLAHAAPLPLVEYRQAPADASGLPDASVDLVTVAQALHWLPLDPFYAEVRRVVVPGGLIEEKVVRVVRRHGIERQVILISFDHLVLREAKLIAPEIATGILYVGGLVDAVAGARAALADSLNPHWAYVTPELVRAAHAAGIAVSAWNPNDAATLRRLSDMGVGSAGTDYPELFGQMH